MNLKKRFEPSLIDLVPYLDLFDPDNPSFAPVCMMGQCPTHGLERITGEGVGGGSDPTHLYYFACGEVDPASFG